MPDTIHKITAQEIMDSRGTPTVEVTVVLSNGMGAKAAVPSGASTGMYEATELRDHDPDRYDGKGVLQAVANVQGEIAQTLHGMKITDQRAIDLLMIELDGTDNKSRLGANAILGVSMAVARAAALTQGVPLYRYLRTLSALNVNATYRLPVPLMNIVNGGQHADNNLDFQEFWVIPSAADTFSEKLAQAMKVFKQLGSALKAHAIDTRLGDEGGYAGDFESHRQVFEIMMQAIKASGYDAGRDIFLGIDAAASEFYTAEKHLYELPLEKSALTHTEIVHFYLNLLRSFPIEAMEDPLAEDDWPGWQAMTKASLENNIQVNLIGDDLFVTNKRRLIRGIESTIANSILIKLNQVGTVTETLATIATALEHKYKLAISHRSGETHDSFIADLAVAVNADYIKTGATSQAERLAKYNRLLAIEKELYD